MRARACNDAGCGPEVSSTVDVVRDANLRLERAVDDEGNIRPRTIHANWDPVEGADSYILRWWRLGTDAPSLEQSQGRLGAVGRQRRSVSGVSAQGFNAQSENELTLTADRTGVDISVPDDGAYEFDLQVQDEDDDLLAKDRVMLNQRAGQPDTTAPRLVRGEIDGNTMTLYFSEPIDEDSLVGQTDFSDNSTGYFSVSLAYARTLAGVGLWTIFGAYGSIEGSGSKVTIVFRGLPARKGLPAIVRYFRSINPPDKVPKDLAGNPLHTPEYYTSDQRTTRAIYLHNITGLPWPERATVDRNRLILTFDEALDKNSVPAASAFTVKVNGSAVSLASINPVAITGNAVTLTLAAAVNTGDTVAVSYASPSTNPLRNAVGAVRDFADVSATLLNSVPWVEGVAISSDPGDNGAYALGENIHVRLSFSEAVDVDTTGGAPRLKIKLDPDYGEKWATYESGDGTKTLVFAYTVADPNRSDQGVAVLRNTLELNGGAIRSTTTMAANAHLRHEGLDHDPSHLVNGTIPKLQGATADGTRLVLTYDEALDENSVPAGNAFTVKVNGSVASLAVDAPVDVRSSSVTLTLATAVDVSDGCDGELHQTNDGRRPEAARQSRQRGGEFLRPAGWPRHHPAAAGAGRDCP